MEFGPVGSVFFAGSGFGCPLSPAREPKNNWFSGSGLPKDETSENANKPASKAARTGYTCGGINAGMYVLSGVKGPFTPSQWLELQHQALIYKHFITNEPMPHNLLIPIRKALESARLSGFAADPLRPNAFTWGPFHPGFSNSIDPEPGRCRRTDGKKWRCTRDAVADQKYCERHINRGRHRSRKPVEGQTESSVSGAATATTTTTSTTKLMPMVSFSLASMPGGVASNIFNIRNQQFRNLLVDASDSPASSSLGKRYAGQNTSHPRFIPPDLDRDNSFPPPKHQIQSGELATSDFGVPSTESLLNISRKITCVCGSHASSQYLNNPLSEVQNSLCQGIWNIPLSESDRPSQSISVGMDPMDFMPSTSSCINERVTGSHLSSSLEHDLVQWGLGVGKNLNEPKTSRADWTPISWENCSSGGGPLGEVLRSTKGSLDDHRDAAGLNLLIRGWHRSPHFSSSSPTDDVLPKIPSGTVSNSSAGSSPRTTEKSKTPEGGNQCHEPLSKVVQSFSLPFL